MRELTLNATIDLSDALEEVKDSELVDEVVKRMDGLADSDIDKLKEGLEEIDAYEGVEQEHKNSIRTTDYIYWSAGNIMDQQVMEQLAEAYEKLTPVQIMERLKV